MKKLFILFAIVSNCCYSQTFQQRPNVDFSLKKLDDIASLLPARYLVDKDSVMACPEICGNKSIVIQYNDKHQVSHLGISMFSKETKEILNRPVCDFVERLLLELALAKNNDEINTLLNHYGIQFQRNGRKFGEGMLTSLSAILNEIEEPALFSLSKDDKSYTVSWEYGLQNMLVIQFPLNRELITGANKLESDNVLADQLRDNNCDRASDIKKFFTNDAELVSNDNNIYICKGDTFMLGLINENTYYKKANGRYELIDDENLPKETLANIFMGNSDSKKLKIHIKHSMYGNFTPEYEISLNDFICFFSNDFKVYAATYQRDARTINATVIFQNKQYNYIHLLIISTPKDNIFKENGVINASFRSNIPQQNINNLMGDLIR